MSGSEKDKRQQEETARIDIAVKTIEGHSIVSAHYWNDDANGQGGGVSLTLDDGRTVAISGWGHDWWGVTVEIDGKDLEDTP